MKIFTYYVVLFLELNELSGSVAVNEVIWKQI